MVWESSQAGIAICVAPAAQRAGLAFERVGGGKRFRVVLNLGVKPVTMRLGTGGVRIVASTHLDRDGDRAGPPLELIQNETIALAL